MDWSIRKRTDSGICNTRIWHHNCLAKVLPCCITSTAQPLTTVCLASPCIRARHPHVTTCVSGQQP
jgi:hypothetical protein